MADSSKLQALPPEVLHYFQGVLEGEPGLPPFGQWFADNDVALERWLCRGSYLRLKHGSVIPELRRILTQHGVAFSEVPDVRLPRGPQSPSWIRPEWLQERVDPFAAVGPEGVHFNDLLQMIELKRTGDELRHFRSPADGWKNLCGLAGIALVRGESVVYAIVTLQS